MLTNHHWGPLDFTWRQFRRLKAVSQKILHPWYEFKMTNLRLHPYLPGTNELKHHSSLFLSPYRRPLIPAMVPAKVSRLPPPPTTLQHLTTVPFLHTAKFTCKCEHVSIYRGMCLVKMESLMKNTYIVIYLMSLQILKMPYKHLDCLFKSLRLITRKQGKHPSSTLVALCEGNPPVTKGFP